MIYLLLFAVLFAALVGETVDAIIIWAIIVLNACVGTWQEYSAQKSLEALKQFSRIYAKVYRDGNLVTLDSKELVPGDIVVLAIGDKIPADGKVLLANGCMVQESILTGESESILKNAIDQDPSVPLLERSNMLFSGTIVTQWTATFQVTETWMKTQMWLIADLLTKNEDTQTPLQVKLDRFGRIVTIGVLIVTILVFIILVGNDFRLGTRTRSGILPFFLVALSIAVAAVPEALPAVVTIALSVWVKRMLSKKVLVRNLASVETLGSCTVICTDKTWTLTQNQMSVVHARTPDASVDFHNIGYTPVESIDRKADPLLFWIGQVCTNASLYKQEEERKISWDPTEAALLVSAAKIGQTNPYEKVSEIPFDEARKMMSVVAYDQKENKHILASKWALEQIIGRCTHILVDGKIISFTDTNKQTIIKKNQELTGRALRVLWCAYKPLVSHDDPQEADLIFVGLQALMDPPRLDVSAAVKMAHEAGIRIIMITWDHPSTAQWIAKLIGINSKVLTSQDLANMSDDALAIALEQATNIFARIIPQHKQRIVSLLQKQGHIVAMIGDWVNDAPALKQSHIGIAVETWSEIAKDASDCVLLDNSFTSIVHGIEQWRWMYDNIQKSIILLLSGNFVEVSVLVIAIFFGRGLPLTALMILWINLISDSLPAIAYSFDDFDASIMKRKPLDVNEWLLPYSKSLMLFSLWVLACIISLSFYMTELAANPAIAQTLVFQYIVFFQLILVLFVRHSYGTKFLSNKVLRYVLLFLLILQLSVSYWPLATLFDIYPLILSQRVVIIAAAFIPFIVIGLPLMLIKVKKSQI